MRLKHLLAGLLAAGLSSGVAHAQSPGIGGAPNPQPTISANPPTILTNQVPIAATSTAVPLGSGALTNGIVITAPTTNAKAVCVGSSNVTTTSTGAGNGYCLTPGTSISFGVTNLSAIYINGQAGDWVQYAGN